MSPLSRSINRLKRLWKRCAWYVRENGLLPFFRQLQIRLRRLLFDNRSVVFRKDLSAPFPQEIKTSLGSLSLKRYRHLDEVPLSFIDQMSRFKVGSDLVIKDLESFFRDNADLWTLHSGDQAVAYGWTIDGGARGFYFFPLRRTEVVIHAIETLSAFRGHGAAPIMLQKILKELHAEGLRSVYIHSKVWNRPSLRCISKAGFEPIGVATSATFGKRRVVIWKETPADLRPTLEVKSDLVEQTTTQSV